MGKKNYIVNENCPHCGVDVEMIWNTETDGFKAYCPHCGKRLMLCDACQHQDGEHHNENWYLDCDYNSATDTCKHNKYNVMSCVSNTTICRTEESLRSILVAHEVKSKPSAYEMKMNGYHLATLYYNQEAYHDKKYCFCLEDGCIYYDSYNIGD